MTQCKKHHLLFIPLENGSYRAMDTWCGVQTQDRIWFCSKNCWIIYEKTLGKRHGKSRKEHGRTS